MQPLTGPEATRAAGLKEYGLLPTVSNQAPLVSLAGAPGALDNLVRLATQLCGVPYGVVNIITPDQQVQIAADGVDPGVCSREDSMCAKVFFTGRTTVVRDASIDPLFANNPFVTGELGAVRFYASVPLETTTGLVLGSLCVFSLVPDVPSEEQIALLEVLARQVVELLELQHRTMQLDGALAELQRSNTMLAEFAGRVSHDLRAPLTTILGYVELAEDDSDLPPEHPFTDYLSHIGNGGRRMLGTLEDVLAYARADGMLNRQPVSLLAVTAEAAHDLGLGLALGADTIIGHGVACDDIEVYADRAQLRAMIQNLLANSLNYRSETRELQIAVSAEQGPLGVTIRVADNGKGISPADRARAVEPLVRLNRPGDGSGSGLGLATCRRIALSHGGDLSIGDTFGGGATVSVLFPGPAAE